MKFGSVCSGIEAATVAWHGLGWRAAWLAEIDKFASAVLAHHYPSVPNLGDMTKIARAILTGEVSAPDVLCGGTPCQAFSVAGLRESLADARGNLTLKFVEIANAIDHVRSGRSEDECIVFWENVPGVLSTKDNAFGCFLAGLAGEDEPLQPPGQKWANAGAVYGPRRTVAWRTLDAQYFGVAQRRRRVFVVASARKGFDPAQVLFEWDGVRRNSAPSREARQTAPTIPSRSSAGGGLGTDFDCDGGMIPALSQCITTGTGQRYDPETETILPVPFDTTQITSAANGSNPQPGDPCHPLAAGAHRPATAFPGNLSGTQCASTEELAPSMGATNPTAVAHVQVMPTMTAGGPADTSHNQVSGQMRDAYTVPTTAMQVRRLTPEECEALQGFPRGYTRIPNWNGWRDLDHGENPEDIRTEGLQVKQSKKTGKWRVNDPDGPRYKALGNSWAVPNVAWIGRRIHAVLHKT